MFATERQSGPRIQVRAIEVGGRIPPHNLEAEQAVISAITCDPQALVAVRTMEPPLRAEHFYSDANRRIVEAAYAIADRKEPVDTITIASELRDRERLQAIGGVSYLAKLIDATPAVAHVEAHARIIQEKAKMRALDDACARIRGEIYGDYGEAPAFFAFARRAIEEATEGDNRGLHVTMADAVERRVSEIRDQWAGKREAWGLPMPWKRLHRQLHGFSLGTVNFVSALEGGGKSVFALQWALHVAGKTYLDEKIGALFFSMEMPVEDMVTRSLLHLANTDDRVGLTWGELQTGKTREGDELGGWKLAAIDAATATLRAMPFVFEPRRKTISEIKLVVRRVKTQMRAVGVRLRAVVIDHVHLIKLDDQRRGTYSEGLAESVNGFKDLALDEDLVVLAPAQLTQDAARREGKIVVGDIRDAAAIKQIGDNIILIDRPWIKMADKSSNKAREVRNDATFIAGKVRNGAAGEVPARDGGGRFRFDEMDRDMPE